MVLFIFAAAYQVYGQELSDSRVACEGTNNRAFFGQGLQGDVEFWTHSRPWEVGNEHQ